jgi:hypothetical protein
MKDLWLICSSMQLPSLSSAFRRFREWSTLIKVLSVLTVKLTLLFIFVPVPFLDVWGNTANSGKWSLYRIYEESIQRYIMQDTFYLEVAAGKDGNTVFSDLLQQGVITDYYQPFTALDIPYYRVEFSVRDDVAKRLIALMVHNGTINKIEWVPIFEIQQTGVQGFGHHGGKTRTLENFEAYAENNVIFSTQQVRKKTFERQWYTDDIGLVSDNLTCLVFERPKQKVAIIDNAFMSNHPNIKQALKLKLDIADGDSNVLPPSLEGEWMHGSYSAWLIAGRKHDGEGIIGTSLGSAEVYALKATSDSAGPTEITHGIEAFAKAIELDVDVISLSRWAYIDFPVFKELVKKAVDKGIVVIAAAGNYGEPDRFYPAAYNGVIAVGAYDKTTQRASFSNYGTWVDIYAPGEDLVVPMGTGSYASTDGTSSAAPLFAGIYALLMRAHDSETDLEELYMKKIKNLPYLDLTWLCPDEPEPTTEPVWIIQQVEEPEEEPEEIEEEPITEPEEEPQEEPHTAAPDPIAEPVPTLREQLVPLLHMWWWWMIASCLLVIMLVIRVMKKPKPVLLPPESVE